MIKRDIISQDRLLNACMLVDLKANVELLDEVDSTNSTALSNKKDTHLLVATRQTQGVGRRTNRWNSQPGDVILSYSFMYSSPPPSHFSLNVGVAISESLRRLGGKELLIKWPNDLVYSLESTLIKVGGILIDVASQQEKFLWVVGVGINVTTSPGLRQLHIDAPLERIIAHVAKAIEDAPHEFDINRFNEFNALQNKRITFINPKGETISGRARSIGKDGTLGIEISKKMHFFNNIHSIRLHETTN